MRGLPRVVQPMSCAFTLSLLRRLHVMCCCVTPLCVRFAELSLPESLHTTTVNFKTKFTILYVALE